MSRPQAPIDWKKVDELLIAGCLGTEIAAYFSMHPNTFYDRVQLEFGIGFTEYSQQKRSKGDALLRARQYAKALSGDNTMMVWLGKNRLNQRDGEIKEQTPPNELYLAVQHDNMKLKNRIQELETKLNECKPQTSEELLRSDTPVQYMGGCC